MCACYRCGAATIGHALREGAAGFAASAHALGDALRLRAAAVSTPAPPTYAAIQGPVGLAAADPAWLAMLRPLDARRLDATDDATDDDTNDAAARSLRSTPCTELLGGAAGAAGAPDSAPLASAPFAGGAPSTSSFVASAPVQACAHPTCMPHAAGGGPLYRLSSAPCSLTH